MDNHKHGAPVKKALRQEALDFVGGARAASVLDLFAGEGRMYSAVWSVAARYLGTDKDIKKALKHPASCHHATADVVACSVDLSAWNVFDFDAYGTPWREVSMVAARRKLFAGERVAFVITDGSARRAMLGHVAKDLARAAGLSRDMPGHHQRWEHLARAALENLAAKMGGEVTFLRHPVGGTGSRGVWYGMAALTGSGHVGKLTPEAPV